MTLASELLRLRKSKGLTLLEVEEKTDVPNGYLSMLENGKISNPQAARLGKLCLLYEADMDKIFSLAI